MFLVRCLVSTTTIKAISISHLDITRQTGQTRLECLAGVSPWFNSILGDNHHLGCSCTPQHLTLHILHSTTSYTTAHAVLPKFNIPLQNNNIVLANYCTALLNANSHPASRQAVTNRRERNGVRKDPDQNHVGAKSLRNGNQSRASIIEHPLNPRIQNKRQ